VASAYYKKNDLIHGESALDIGELTKQTNTIMGKAGEFFDHLQKTEDKLNVLLDQTTETAKSMNVLVSDPSIRKVTANLADASQQASYMAKDIRRYISSDNLLLAHSLSNVNDVTGSVKQLSDTSRSSIVHTLDNIDKVTTQANKSVASINAILDNTKEAWIKGNAADNITDTIENLKRSSAKLAEIEDDLRAITGDKTVQDNVKTTITNVAAASGKTNELIARLTSLTGGTHSSIRPTESRLMFIENMRTNNFRTDFDIYIPQNQESFFRAGVRDLTETNRLNFQYGQRYNDRVSLRAGVYNNKVALGADYGLFDRNSMTLDLYDPNHPHLDIRQRIGVGDEAAIWFGVEDTFGSSGLIAGFDLRH
jgi:ABC-type transporter Mla subunit MlaD